MLETVTSQHFLPLVDKELEFVAHTGEHTLLTLKEVSEKEEVRFPYDDGDVRAPFSLILKGSLDETFVSAGLCHIRGLPSGELQNVYVSRIVQQSREPSAWYQVIFN